jgi:predicted nuclease of predicted toxin-antitoxin system
VNLLADESVDRQIVDRLRREGHTVRYVAEMEPGIPNDAVLDLANQEADVLLTANRDLREMVFRQGRLTSGIFLVRPAGLSPARKVQIVAAAVNLHSQEPPGGFAVLTPGSFPHSQAGVRR